MATLATYLHVTVSAQLSLSRLNSSAVCHPFNPSCSNSSCASLIITNDNGLINQIQAKVLHHCKTARREEHAAMCEQSSELDSVQC